MDIKLIIPPILMVIAFILYFIVGYRFIKKHKREKDGSNKTVQR